MALSKLDHRSTKTRTKNLSSTIQQPFNQHSSEEYAIVALKNKAKAEPTLPLNEQSVVVSYKNGFNNSLRWTLSMLESKDFTRTQVIEALKGAFL